MVNNKGYLRILEAVIAVVLLLGVMLFISTRSSVNDAKTPSNVVESMRIILEKISVNETLRSCIVNFTYVGECRQSSDLFNGLNCGVEINKTIFEEVPLGYSYTCEICNQSLSCLTTAQANVIPWNKSVFTDTIFLAKEDIEKVVRLYLWR